MSPKRIRVIAPGDVFGRGRVIEAVRMPNGQRGARLRCDPELGGCGTIYETWVSSLFKTTSPTRSCGCLRRETTAAQGKARTRLTIVPGDVFSRGRVVEKIRMPGGQRGARLLCDPELGGCGTVYEAVLSSLFNGRTQSCGCLSRENSVAQGRREKTPEWRAAIGRAHTTLIITPGDQFGRGRVIKEIRIVHPSGRTSRGAQLLCDPELGGCGTIYEAQLGNLFATTSPTRSCGCLRHELAGASLTRIGLTPGDVFGRGVVIEETQYANPGGGVVRGARLLCCPELGGCGTIYETRLYSLTNGESTSCGCQRRETAAAQKLVHGLARKGAARHPLFQTWNDMMRRCYSPKNENFKDYGGRGIAVCKRWHSVELFAQDILALIGPKPTGILPGGRSVFSIDRFPDNDGGYWCGHCDECVSKGQRLNVRWADPVMQARNTRRYLGSH